MNVYVSHSQEETFSWGKKLGKALPPNSVVCFFGELAAGKTTFIKGLASAASLCSPDDVNSPTFVYLNIYNGVKTIFHFDLYRLRGADEFLEMGFDEYLYSGGISCIEWSERIASLVPEDAIVVEICHVGENKRRIAITHR